MKKKGFPTFPPFNLDYLLIISQSLTNNLNTAAVYYRNLKIIKKYPKMKKNPWPYVQST